ncbi:MAG: branched-chain amino acid ABC transporter permease [Desulfobacteraceae bacterium]|nr:branched-chain amino acid ABC transporter permease [Desulfobacteraceae bacterium]
MGWNRLKWFFPMLIFSGAILVFVLRSTMNDYVLSIVCFAGINIILAVSLNLTNGFTGLFSLGHPAFMAVGGYVAAILTFPVARKAMLLPALPGWLAAQQWSLLPALILGGLSATFAAFLVGFPVLRLKGHYLAVATLGFIIILKVFIINLESFTRGPLGLNGLPMLTNLWWVYMWAVITIYVCWKVKHSSLGRSMLAIRENEMAAECLGIPLTRTRIMAFALGAFFAGVGGGLWAHLVTAITPTSFSVIMAFNLVVMVVVGGSGSITGAVFAAVMLTVVVDVLRPLEESLEAYGISELIIAIGLLSILLFRPRGLFGSQEPAFLLRQKKTVSGEARGALSYQNGKGGAA